MGIWKFPLHAANSIRGEDQLKYGIEVTPKKGANLSELEQRWWVYMIETARGTIYTGISTDPARRFEEHMAVYRGEAGAKGAKFFRSVAPVALLYKEQCGDRSAATKREAQIKRLKRGQKLQLIARV